jgi:predicted dehydrogenase
MKFLVAGIGSIGRRHINNLLTLGEKDIILFRQNKSTLPDTELNNFPVETNIESALNHKPDAVIVSNPTSLHLDVAIPAAEAGCHILLEKPISHSLDRIADLKSAVKRGKGQILVGFQYRYHPTLQIAARIISDGHIGNPVYIHSHWGEFLPDWHPWEDYKNSYASRKDLGGGVILTLCHPFDYIKWLLGKSRIVWAQTANLGNLGIQVEDVAEIGLKFSNGAIGSIYLDFIQKPASHYLEIIGTDGTINWNNSNGALSVYDKKNSNWEYFSPPNGFERNWMFLEEMRHFLKICRNEEFPCCTLDDGIDSLEIALQSLALNN